MKLTKISIISCALTLICSFSVTAKLNVVSDYGGTSMGPYYEMLDPTDVESENKMQDLAPESLKIDEGTYLPVHSMKLTPAIFEKYEISFPTLQSFFIVGHDDLSIQWLKERHQYLEKMPGLVGVVVNIESISELNELKSLINLPMYAMPGDELATTFKLIHYPALVTSKSVEQ